jgi:8-oxo-dGTP pyrophosphatase MutT (NUDIX family)
VSEPLSLPADWLQRLHGHADRPPARPRLPLQWGADRIGSVEAELVAKLHPASPAVRALLSIDGAALAQLSGEDLTATLNVLALALRDAGLAHAWRDEQLAVRSPQGKVLATVERGVVRALGIATHAVHLAGRSPDGRHWVQQRSLTKSTDPGLWDTLMGGMVPASDSLEQALERETWEEAGLRIAQLESLAHGGQVTTRGPSAEHPYGYVVETVDWYRCVVPAGVEPSNQDGEVSQFRQLGPAELRDALLAGEFTTEAALVLAAAELRPC